MTSPGGGDPNHIDLATLWLPVTAETSHLVESVRQGAMEARRAAEEEFSRGGNVGETFGKSILDGIHRSGLTEGLQTVFGAFEKGFGGSSESMVAAERAFDRYTNSLKSVEDATGRVHVAQTRLQDLQDKGTASNGQLVAATERLAAAQRNVEQRTREAATAHESLSSAQDHAQHSTGLSVVGITLLSSAVSAATSAVIDLVQEGFMAIIEVGEKAAETVLELGKEALELGEKWENLNDKLVEFSQNADALKPDLANVLDNLDASSVHASNDLALLSTRLGLTGEQLDTTTRHVEILRDRMGTFNIDALTASMTAFGDASSDADDNLALLVATQQKFGTNLNVTVGAVNSHSEAMERLGLSYQQAIYFAAQLEAVHPGEEFDDRSIAMITKNAQKRDETDAQYIKREAAIIQGHKDRAEAARKSGDSATYDSEMVAAEGEAMAAFGKKMDAGLASANAFNDAISKTPEELAALSRSGDVDQLAEKTHHLHQAWDEFYNKIIATAGPVAQRILEIATHGLDSLSGWFKDHHEEIVNKIGEWGKKAIDTLPSIKTFVDISIELFEALAVAMVPVADLMLGIAGSILVASGNLQDGLKLFDMVDKLHPGSITGPLDEAKAKADHLLDGAISKTGELKQGITDAVSQSLQLNSGSAAAPVPGAPTAANVPAAAPPPTGGSQSQVASYIISKAQAAGFSPEQTQAILSTALQESGLNEGAKGGGGAWHGVFQQDTSYPNRDSAQGNIDAFFQRLGAPSADIWSQIFTLQQGKAPTAPGARTGYMGEIQSQLPSATALYNQISSGGGAPVASAPVGAAAPVGTSPVAGAPSAGAPSASTSAADVFAAAQSGKPYSYGGYGDAAHGGLFDCSGFMSGIYSVMTGRSMPGGTRFFSTTSDFKALGFIPTNQPVPGAFNIGVNPSPGMSGHMAGTLPSGVNVESGGAANQTQYGGSAAGAWNPEFSEHYFLPPGSKGAGGVAGMPTGPVSKQTLQEMERQNRIDSSNDAVVDANNTLAHARQEAAEKQQAANTAAAALANTKLQPGDEAYTALQTSAQKAAQASTEANDAVTRAAHGVNSAVTSAGMAQQEAMQPLSGGKGSGPAHDFGSQFLGGIADSLGLGGVLGGKSPMDWASVKMGTGLLSWMLGPQGPLAGRGGLGGLGGLGGGGLGEGGLPMPGGDPSGMAALAGGLGGGGGGGGGFDFPDLAANLGGGAPGAAPGGGNLTNPALQGGPLDTSGLPGYHPPDGAFALPPAGGSGAPGAPPVPGMNPLVPDWAHKTGGMPVLAPGQWNNPAHSARVGPPPSLGSMLVPGSKNVTPHWIPGFDAGGVLAPGINVVHNATGKPESLVPSHPTEGPQSFAQASLENAFKQLGVFSGAGGADAQPTQISNDNSITIHDNTLSDHKDFIRQMQETQNSRFYSITGGLPYPSVGAP